MKRRAFLKKTALASTAFGLGLYTYRIEPFWLEFVRKEMPIAHLPEHLVGKTLMQISDIHVGTRFDYRYIMDSLLKAREFSPDFVVYTGDFVAYEGESEQFRRLSEVLSSSLVRGKLGTLGILGNHDYGENWSEPIVAYRITELLTNHGIQILRNEQVSVNGLNIIGFDDYWGTNFRPSEAMQDYDPEKATIVLCHNPDVCDLPVWNGFSGWILAGHTHGGQCRPPFLPAPILPVKNKNYSEGQIDLGDGRTLYINRALGHMYQVRFNVRPEITIFELKKAEPTAKK